MKKIIFALLIIYSSLLIVNAQWQPDARLSNDINDSYTSYNNALCVASSGNIVHVVWFDNYSGGVYYKRSNDAGISWGAAIRLNDFHSNTFYYYPSISVSGSDVHVIYVRNHNAYDIVSYKRSTDGGVTWGSEIQVTSTTNSSQFPSISVSGLEVHAVWQFWTSPARQIQYVHSTDRGASWGALTQLTNSPGNLSFPSVSVSGLTVHIIWYSYDNGIYYKRSTDGGTSWLAETRLSSNQAISKSPSVTLSGSLVYVVWQDYRDLNCEIYYKRSTDAGSGWGADSRLTNAPDSSVYPSVTASGQIVHVVWQDNRVGNWEIYYKRSTDGGTSWGADSRLTNNSANSQYPSMSISGSAVNVIWQDNRDGNYEIYYKRDPTGNLIGIKSINSEIPKEFSLYQNYPNPFNPTTKIRFAIPSAGAQYIEHVQLIIYDILGKELSTLVNEQLNPGTYEVEWPAPTGNASNYPSGVYFYKLISNQFTETKKMVLVK